MFHNKSTNRAPSLPPAPLAAAREKQSRAEPGRVKTGPAAAPPSLFPASPGRARGDETARRSCRLRRRELPDTQNKNTFTESNAIFLVHFFFLNAKTGSLSLHKELILAVISYGGKAVPGSTGRETLTTRAAQCPAGGRVSTGGGAPPQSPQTAAAHLLPASQFPFCGDKSLRGWRRVSTKTFGDGCVTTTRRRTRVAGSMPGTGSPRLIWAR